MSRRKQRFKHGREQDLSEAGTLNSQEIPGAELRAGVLVDERYLLQDLIGEGGVGSLFRATETGLERPVAIKFLQSQFLGNPESESRFLREGKVLSSLQHPNIVSFYRFGCWHNLAYIAMEYLQGSNLRALIDSDEQLQPDRCIDFAAQICDAMAAAHTQGIVHRDLKPGNIIITIDLNDQCKETVKIVDFGLSSLADPNSIQQHLTQTGELIGSVLYMSPEQCLGKKTDQRTDIYALGCILYELLCRTPPHNADNPIGLIHKHVHESPHKMSKHTKAALPLGLESVVLRALEKEPQNRYQTMLEFKHELELVAAGRGIEVSSAPAVEAQRSRVPQIAVAATTVVALLIAISAGLLLKRSEEPELTHSIVARRFPDYTELFKMPEERRKQYCMEWLRRSKDTSKADTARAHYWLVREQIRSSDGDISPVQEQHLAAAFSNHKAAVTEQKTVPPEGIRSFLHSTSSIADLLCMKGESGKAIIFLKTMIRECEQRKLTMFARISLIEQLYGIYDELSPAGEEEYWLREHIGLTGEEGLTQARSYARLARLLHVEGHDEESKISLHKAWSLCTKCMDDNAYLGQNIQYLLCGTIDTLLPLIEDCGELSKAERLVDRALVLANSKEVEPSIAGYAVTKAKILLARGQVKQACTQLRISLEKVAKDQQWRVLEAATSNYEKEGFHSLVDELTTKILSKRQAALAAAVHWPYIMDTAIRNHDVELAVELEKKLFNYVVSLSPAETCSIFPSLERCAASGLSLNHNDGDRSFKKLLELTKSFSSPQERTSRRISAACSWSLAYAGSNVHKAEEILQENLTSAEWEGNADSGADCARIQETRAYIYQQTGDLRKALSLMQLAILFYEKTPNYNLKRHINANRQLARLLAAAGEKDSADSYITSARVLEKEYSSRIYW